MLQQAFLSGSRLALPSEGISSELSICPTNTLNSWCKPQHVFQSWACSGQLPDQTIQGDTSTPVPLGPGGFLGVLAHTAHKPAKALVPLVVVWCSQLCCLDCSAGLPGSGKHPLSRKRMEQFCCSPQQLLLPCQLQLQILHSVPSLAQAFLRPLSKCLQILWGWSGVNCSDSLWLVDLHCISHIGCCISASGHS